MLIEHFQIKFKSGKLSRSTIIHSFSMKVAILKAVDGKGDIFINCVPFAIGRSKTAHFVIPDLNISRNHCEIVYENFLWKINDLSSSGTYINNTLIGKGATAILKEEDSIRLGYPENKLVWIFFTKNSHCRLNEKVQAPFGITNESSNVEKAQNVNKMLIERPTIQELNKEKGVKYIPQLIYSNKTNISNSVTLENFCRPEINNENVSQLLKQNDQKTHDKIKVEVNNHNHDSEKKAELDIESSKVHRNIQEKLKHVLVNNSNKNMGNITDLQEVHDILLETLINSYNNGLSKLNESLDGIKKRALETELEQKNGLLVDSDNLSKSSGKFKEVNTEVKSDLNLETMKDVDTVKFKTQLLQNVSELIETELQCTICSELFVCAVTLQCGHTFCEFCINQWKKKQKTCPICRKKIKTETQSLVINNYLERMVENLSSELKCRRKELIKQRMEVVPSKKARVKKSI